MSYVRNFKRMIIDVQDDGTHLLHLGEIEIWDGADLALLREGLALLIEKDNCRSIAVDMQFVKYIPSGFFGMLFDWYERRSVAFTLTPPQRVPVTDRRGPTGSLVRAPPMSSSDAPATTA